MTLIFCRAAEEMIVALGWPLKVATIILGCILSMLFSDFCDRGPIRISTPPIVALIHTSTQSNTFTYNLNTHTHTHTHTLTNSSAEVGVFHHSTPPTGHSQTRILELKRINENKLLNKRLKHWLPWLLLISWRRYKVWVTCKVQIYEIIKS